MGPKVRRRVLLGGRASSRRLRARWAATRSPRRRARPAGAASPDWAREQNTPPARTSRARRLLPTPPAPVMSTQRPPPRASRTWARAAGRPFVCPTKVGLTLPDDCISLGDDGPAVEHHRTAFDLDGDGVLERMTSDPSPSQTTAGSPSSIATARCAPPSGEPRRHGSGSTPTTSRTTTGSRGPSPPRPTSPQSSQGPSTPSEATRSTATFWTRMPTGATSTPKQQAWIRDRDPPAYPRQRADAAAPQPLQRGRGGVHAPLRPSSSGIRAGGVAQPPAPRGAPTTTLPS